MDSINHVDLHRNSLELDRQLQEQANSKEPVKVTLPSSDNSDLLESIQTSGDPFGGNPNNRRVAERLAEDGEAATVQSNKLPNRLTDKKRIKDALKLSEGQESAQLQDQQDKAKNDPDVKTGSAVAPVWKPGK